MSPRYVLSALFRHHLDFILWNNVYFKENEPVKSKIKNLNFLHLSLTNHIFIIIWNTHEMVQMQTYVQDLAAKEADDVYKLIVLEEGHIYVCGDVTMAEHVYLTIRYVNHVSSALVHFISFIASFLIGFTIHTLTHTMLLPVWETS